MPETKLDEFAFVLVAGVSMIIVLMVIWLTPREPLPLIEPQTILLEVEKGAIQETFLWIKGKATNVTLTASGQIKDWVTFDKNYFNVLEETKVTIKFSIPKNVPVGIYVGNIIVKSAGGEIPIPVELHVKPSITPSLKQTLISLGDFSLEKVSEKETLKVAEDLEVFKGYFSEQKVTLTFSIPENKVDKVDELTLRIYIGEANRYGNLLIKINDVEIYDRIPGNEIELKVKATLLNVNNTLEILAAEPGFYFWANNFYRINKIMIEIEYENVYQKTFNFTLASNQAQNFEALRINYLGSYEGTFNLIIKLNGQIIYYAKPKLFFNSTFEKDIFGNEINLKENNQITFEIDEEGNIEFKGVQLIIYYT